MNADIYIGIPKKIWQTHAHNTDQGRPFFHNNMMSRCVSIFTTPTTYIYIRCEYNTQNIIIFCTPVGILALHFTEYYNIVIHSVITRCVCVCVYLHMCIISSFMHCHEEGINNLHSDVFLPKSYILFIHTFVW